MLRRLHQRFDDAEQPGFLDTEPEDYMGESSAGPHWARSSIAYFTDSVVRPMWAIRTWWGHRVIIDLERAEFLDESALDGDLARNLEIEWIEDALAAGVEKLEKEQELIPSDVEDGDRGNWTVITPVMTAVYHAGWLQAESSVPFLYRIEELGPVYLTASFGPVRWATLFTLPLRQIAKMALLRIGKEPKWLPHYSFEIREGVLARTTGLPKMFPLPEQGNVRDFQLLKPRFTQTETLYRLGAPDFIDRNYWDYDVHSKSVDQTTRIVWDDFHGKNLPSQELDITVNESDLRIARIQIIEPQWRQITIRDHFLV